MLFLSLDVGSQLREDCFESHQLVLVFILGFEKKCTQSHSELTHRHRHECKEQLYEAAEGVWFIIITFFWHFY